MAKAEDFEKLNQVVNAEMGKAQKHNKTDIAVKVGGFSEKAQLDVAYAMQRFGHRVYFTNDRERGTVMNVNFNKGDSPRG